MDYDARRSLISQKYLTASETSPPTSAQGVHHLALICSDIERTIEFYTQVLGFPLVELFQNRDLPSSTHFFFDIGHGNLLAFFDFPEHPMPSTRESVGGMHHVAISVPADKFSGIVERLAVRGISNVGPPHVTSSIYFHDPDGALLEIIQEPLLMMEGHPLGR
ncbi:MAG: VOC family protein [Chloroflexota bacterium]